MKNFKFLIYIVSVALIVIVFDFIFNFTVEKVMDGKYNTKIYETSGANSKIAVIGASRALHHYIPSIFEDSLNISTYNYGIDGRNIFVHYAILESLINNSKEKPEIVILDICSTDIYDMPRWNTERINILYPYYHSNPHIKSIIDDLIENPERFILRESGLVRHNSELINDFKVIVNKNNIDNKGYEPLYNIWEEDLVINDSESTNKIMDQKINYLKTFIQRCKEEGILPIISISPSFTSRTDTLWISEIKRISVQENIPFIDSHDYNPFLTHKEWYSDPTHLNDIGAKEFTKFFIHQIRDSLKIKL